MIKTILFDMGGVLFLLDTAEAKKRFEALGVDSDRYLGAYGQKGIFHDLESGLIDADEFLRRLSEMTGHEVTWNQARHAWLGYCKGVPQDRLDYLNSLRPKYRTCLASNTNPFIMYFCNSSEFSKDGFPLNHYLDHLYCSYRMGVQKPSAEFFNRIIETEGVTPDEILFVDDSKKNIEAAERLGIHGLWVDSNNDQDWMPELEAKLKELN